MIKSMLSFKSFVVLMMLMHIISAFLKLVHLLTVYVLDKKELDDQERRMLAGTKTRGIKNNNHKHAPSHFNAEIDGVKAEYAKKKKRLWLEHKQEVYNTILIPFFAAIKLFKK